MFQCRLICPLKVSQKVDQNDNFQVTKYELTPLKFQAFECWPLLCKLYGGNNGINTVHVFR